MKPVIEKMTQKSAVIVAQWHYPDEYSFYDMVADPEDYQELMDEEKRGDGYYQVTQSGMLIGFFVVEKTDRQEVVEVGLGMAPELTGQGNGLEFVKIILKYISRVTGSKKVLFDVAKFNIRAQKLYQKIGFEVVNYHEQKTNGGIYPFVLMAKSI
ncbi:GNAT family N-acetyltransferase [Liquorilactobacillus cacaonum]|uniref:Ribosomal-protein-alanine acetyltransferase n=1 Tax=Liquorilactobacillus cacaonum DSM 21116 TaxID=1423729 RepID=A0A0R2CFE4_9LACO|nr:GNAT family protein [Liquorilactobacillus cacaonum]KRM89968.1 ribosomal-protein-alanine acetyltransferase [Liquorilactobacillus cacaonum DSM 21116]